jgi:hypothetical protein
VTAHREAGHPGETIGCQDPECQDRIDAALKATFENLPPGKPAGKLFPA